MSTFINKRHMYVFNECVFSNDFSRILVDFFVKWKQGLESFKLRISTSWQKLIHDQELLNLEAPVLKLNYN